MFMVEMFEMEKRSNSTKRPDVAGFLMECEANEPVDIMAPFFRFRLPGAFRYNYLYVQSWDRYYWIDHWTYDAGLWEANCTIDPLASWRNDIGNMTEYVLRSAKDFDSTVVDTTYPLTARTEVEQVTMPGWEVSQNPTGCHVLGIVSSNGLTEYYITTNLAAFGDAMFSDALWDSVTEDDPGYEAGEVPTFMRAQFNPLQYVVSCMWFPFIPPANNTTSEIFLGYFSTGFDAYTIQRKSYRLFTGSITIPDHPQTIRGVYLNMAPYTRLRLNALPWGEVDLDTTKFANRGTIELEAWLDPVTGSTKLYIANGDGERILTLIGQIGVSEQLSQVLKDNLATVTGGISALAGVGSMFTGNIAGGIATAASGIGNAISAQYPDVSSTGTNGARIAVTPVKIWLTVTHQYIADEDRPNHGRPLCDRRRLSTLPGYQMISDPDVPLPATRAEIDRIKEYMVNGYFYE